MSGVDLPPGFKLTDPGTEAERIAVDRADPPWREWAVRHPGGKVTVRIDGHAFPGRAAAEEERFACEVDCEWCDGGTHALMYRDRQPWQNAPA